jgi:hypothetical protein
MAKRLEKKVEKQIKKSIKKTNKLTLFFTALFLVVGCVGGFFGYKTITQNDTFEIVGNKQITLSVGDLYVEQGAKIVSFGKDISSKVIIEGTVDTTTAGEYAITYSVDDFLFKGVKKVRVVVVE